MRYMAIGILPLFGTRCNGTDSTTIDSSGGTLSESK